MEVVKPSFTILFGRGFADWCCACREHHPCWSDACAGRKLGYRLWPGLSCARPVLIGQSAETLSALNCADLGRNESSSVRSGERAEPSRGLGGCARCWAEDGAVVEIVSSVERRSGTAGRLEWRAHLIGRQVGIVGGWGRAMWSDLAIG